MSVLTDRQIVSRIGLEETDPFRLRIAGFVPELVKEPGKPSWGLTCNGYDCRLDRHFKWIDETAVAQGKGFVEPGDDTRWVEWEGDAVVIPAGGFVLAQTLEYIRVPRDCMGTVFGKSTIARIGVDLNTTPLEPCLSDDTDALTRRGWVPMPDVTLDDELLTRRSDGVAEYHRPVAKQVREYSGKLFHFRGRSVDQLVTPDHKLLVHLRDCQRNTESERLVAASTVFGKHNYSMDRRVNWSGVNPETVEIGDRRYPAPEFMDFLGCWLGDESAYKGADGGYHVKLAVVTKCEKREYFRGILKQLGINARLFERGFHFFDKNLATWLMQFGHARDKYIDRKFLEFSPALLERLLSGLMASDGNSETQTYSTVSERLASDVQEVAFKIGKAAIVRRVVKQFRGTSTSMLTVRVCGAHMTPKIPPRCHGLVDYDGLVYDVTVPNHVFFVRRGGKASWTGNCWEGQVTLEITNGLNCPIKLHAGHGICQCVFQPHDGKGPAVVKTSYADRKNGTYQGQIGVTTSRV